jgi:hypothetical protein
MLGANADCDFSSAFAVDSFGGMAQLFSLGCDANYEDIHSNYMFGQVAYPVEYLEYDRTYPDFSRSHL